ncbi:MAG: lipopolysaccharide transport periplasmic protein LptA [Granulosicoccus sp.]
MKAEKLSGCFRSREKRRLLALVLLCAMHIPTTHLFTAANARKSDLAQAIDVKADRSEFDERKGIQTLQGNVEITQGTMRITADTISISLQDNTLSKIIGTGSPIRFQQENEAGELMQGEAASIIYDARSGTLVLEGKATLTQPRQNLVSDKITFNARTQKVSAEGGGETGRINLQIQPPSTD